MEWLEELWNFLSDETNRDILAFLGSGLVVVVGGIWAVLIYFSNKKDSLTKEDYEKGLKELKEELLQKRTASAPGSEQRELLERELAALEQKRTHLEESLQVTKKLRADTIRLFEKKLAAQLPPDRIEQAKTAIAEGNPTLAETLLQEVVASGIQQSAEASYQLGLLAKDRVDYKTAWKALTRAAELAPGNSQYLNEAGLMANTLGRFDTAIKYFDSALVVDLKTYGPDHPDVATLWNNLGGAWHTKGEYGKAIEYYEKLWLGTSKLSDPIIPMWPPVGTIWEKRGDKKANMTRPSNITTKL